MDNQNTTPTGLVIVKKVTNDCVINIKHQLTTFEFSFFKSQLSVKTRKLHFTDIITVMLRLVV